VCAVAFAAMKLGVLELSYYVEVVSILQQLQYLLQHSTLQLIAVTEVHTTIVVYCSVWQ
jgi:hypothetical protein